jgi:3-(3-hydroxy-phenyl)propionate hydroxylase
LNGDDELDGPQITRVGASCPDAPHDGAFLLDVLNGGFTLLAINAEVPELLDVDGIFVNSIRIEQPDDALAARYLGDQKSAIYLIRPDQHICARWPVYDKAKIRAALNHACGRE